MTKRKSIKGICPVNSKEAEIEINYSKFSGVEKVEYSKGRFECEKSKHLRCNPNACPIYRNAPDKIC